MTDRAQRDRALRRLHVAGLGRPLTLDGGQDTVGKYMLDTLRDPFQVWLNQNMPGNISVEYIDDWFLYHLAYGEVHCSSNEHRSVPVSPKWWE